MRGWIARCGIDGLRFDDADITPRDFLDEIRAALSALRPDIALISQSYDEFHYLAACDLTYEGGTREMLRRRHAALRRGATTFLDSLPPGAIGFTRSDAHEDIVVLANLSAPPLAFAEGLAHVQPLYASGWRRDDATLAPHGWLIAAAKK